jgi:DNA polymerase (family 10)
VSEKDLDLFAFFLRVAGIPENRVKIHLEDFKKKGGSMEEFSRNKVAEECKTLFLKRILMRFSKVYDTPELREKILFVLEKGIPTRIKGDLHVHTDWSDGTYPMEYYVKKAEELGYKYLAITDHSLVKKGTVQMDERKFLEQLKYIDEIQKSTSLKILKGVELDINEDGSLDYSEEILEKANFIMGAVHFDYGQGAEKAFELLKMLLENEYIDVIAHPLNKVGKEVFGSHLDEIADLARKNGKVLEISLVPDRLDESDFLVRNLKNKGIKFSFGSDSHSTKQLELMANANLWIEELNEHFIANFYDDPLEFFEKKN